jgi:hypothetical protein
MDILDIQLCFALKDTAKNYLPIVKAQVVTDVMEEAKIDIGIKEVETPLHC